MPPASDFSLTESEGPDGVCVALRGEVDLAVADRVRAALIANFRAGRRQILDLSAVTFIDSMGLGAILIAAGSAEERARLTLRRSRHAQPNRLFALAGVAELLEVLPPAEPAPPAPEPVPAGEPKATSDREPDAAL
ncbi:STAS domain-containing protein [Conexibacter sp. DBS9H8]|uniref:STAS domain-containing protein n=1 Tax=Conexibacter sp. DBS9H8 TaxID=2937801 RepID=UPI00200F3CCB|nr:STAS domain-containing protein [Conexibacter sp. DBS9H8]